MFSRTRDQLKQYAHHKYAGSILGGISFIESSLFPLPPDLLLIPLAILRPKKAWWFAFVCTITSVLGAGVGYMIGYGFFELIAKPIIHFYDAQSHYDKFIELYQQWGVLVVFVSAVSLIPFKIATIASGALLFNPILFFLACLLGRAIRFYGVVGISLGLVSYRQYVFSLKWVSYVLCLTIAGVILTALALEYWGEFIPCRLCFMQRWAYYIAIPLSLLGILYGTKKYGWGLFLLIGCLFFANTLLAITHIGIEKGFWSADKACQAEHNLPETLEELHQNLEKPFMPSCAEPQKILGLSLSVYNMLASLGIFMLALWGAKIARMQHKHKPNHKTIKDDRQKDK